MKKYLRFNYISALGAVLALCVAGYFFLVHNVMPKYIKQFLPVAEELAKDYINGSVKIGDMTWNGGLSAEVANVVVKDIQGKNVVVLPKTKVHVRPWLALFEPARALTRVEFFEPEVWLRQTKDNKWNMTQLMKPSDSEETPFYGLAEFTKGRLNVETAYGQWNFGVDGSVDGGANPSFALAAKVTAKEELLQLSGLMTKKGVGKLQVNTEKLSFADYAPAVKHYTGIEDFTGSLLNTHVLYEADGKESTVSGESEFTQLGGTLKLAEEEHSFVLGGKVKAAKSILDLQRLDALIDKEQELHLTGKADVHDLDDIGGQGLLTSPKLSYAGYVVEKLRLPFTLSKKLVQIDKASLNYGGGEVRTSVTADLREETLTADIRLKNVAHVLSSRSGDVLQANGALAVVGRMASRGEGKTFQLHAGAESFKMAWKDLLINKLALDGDYDGSKLTIDHFSAWTEEGVLALKGNLETRKDGALNLEGRIADLGIGPVLHHFAGIDGRGKLSMGFKASGTTSSPRFGTLVKLSDVEVQGNVLHEMHGFVSMKDKVLSIRNLGATQTQGRHLLNGTVDLNPAEPKLNLQLESKNVRVEPLVALAKADVSLTGNLDNKMRVSGTAAHPRVEGEVCLSDGSVETYLLDRISGRYLYDDGFISLQDFLINFLTAEVKLSGTMSREKTLDFNLAAQNIDVKKLPYSYEDYNIAGKFDIAGHLSGTVAAPLFDGHVNSSVMRVNGERFTDISGTVKSNMQADNSFDISFKQPHQNAKGESRGSEGCFTAKGNLNLIQKFLKGTVAITDGDIGGLLRMNKLKYALEGNVDGLLDICPAGKGSGVVFGLDSKNISTHALRYDKLSVKGTFRKGIANLNEVLLQEKLSVADRGIIKAYGVYNLRSKSLELHARAVEANPALVNVAMKQPLDIKGLLNMEADVAGHVEQLKGSAKLELLRGALMGVEFDRAGSELVLENDNIFIKELSGNKDAYSLSGNGKIPLDALRSLEARRNPQAEMDISVNLDNTELGILTASKAVDWGTGDIEGRLNIAGTLETPKIFGSLKVEDGTLKLKNVNPVFEHLKLDAEFNGERATLKALSMQLGKKGSLTAEGYYNLNSTAEDAYHMHIVAKDAELSYGTMFKGRINSVLDITPQNYRDYWHRTEQKLKEAAAKTNMSKLPAGRRKVSAVKTVGSRLPRMLLRQQRPLIKGTVRLDDVVANILGFEDSQPGSETNVGLDLKLELGPKIHMLNAMFYDIWLRGGLDVKGGFFSQTTMDPDEDERVIAAHNKGPDGLKIDGKIEASKGSITYLRTVFKLTNAELNWLHKGEIMPYVKLDSWSRFGKYRIYIKIDGQLDDKLNEEILKLSSSPPLEKNTLVRMLTLQRESASGGNDITNDDLNNVMTAGLQMAVLGNVELWIKQTLGLDQFRIYTGAVNAGIAFDGSDHKKQLTADEKNRYNVLISKYMTDRFMVGYTSDFNSDEKVIFGQYDLGRHFNLTYSEKQKMSGDRQHWAGIEYRIDFK